jgi:predicted DCC family thiol-disulfide oxidoreductase YuxK
MVASDSTVGKAVVFYDGVCAMCNGAVRFILERDPKAQFYFTPLQSELAKEALRRHGQTADELDTMYLIANYRQPDEQLFSRSAAVLEAMRRLGGFWQVVSWLSFLPAPLRDFLYSLIVKNRYRLFGRYDTCPLPPPHWRARFLEDLKSQTNTDEHGSQSSGQSDTAAARR